MEDERIHGRDELMAPYEHPYRHALSDQVELRRATLLTLILWGAGAVGFAAGVEVLGVIAGLGGTVAYVILLLWLVAVLRTTWRQTLTWRERSELAAVRAGRPQAGDEDPTVAHDEFAVTAEDNGRLVTWRFRPLAVSQHPAGDEIEVPGRPRYAASPVGETAFDPQDTVLASDQLVAAQAEAAEREATAAAEAHAALDADRARLARAGEARTTAEALQRVTGQRRRRT